LEYRRNGRFFRYVILLVTTIMIGLCHNYRVSNKSRLRVRDLLTRRR
jgi:hypothetical protein